MATTREQFLVAVQSKSALEVSRNVVRIRCRRSEHGMTGELVFRQQWLGVTLILSLLVISVTIAMIWLNWGVAIGPGDVFMWLLVVCMTCFVSRVASDREAVVFNRAQGTVEWRHWRCLRQRQCERYCFTQIELIVCSLRLVSQVGLGSSTKACFVVMPNAVRSVLVEEDEAEFALELRQLEALVNIPVVVSALEVFAPVSMPLWAYGEDESV